MALLLVNKVLVLGCMQALRDFVEVRGTQSIEEEIYTLREVQTNDWSSA